MISDSITAQVCGAPTEAVETAAPWERWKTQKTGFPPFPPRLENSPQKTRSEFSTVPTASAANIFYLKRELVSSRRTSCSRPGSQSQFSDVIGTRLAVQQFLWRAGPGKVFA